MTENRELKVCIVGAGKRFLSGISYYTLHLTNTLAHSHRVSVILMRQLLPKAFYPGRKRVGENLTQLEYDPPVRVFDGVDWYWLPSIVRSLIFLFHERPDILVFQWWSGTVLHSYFLLALVARLLGAKVVIEFHEVLDAGEAKLAPVRAYIRLFAPLFISMAQAFVIHSEYYRKVLEKHYKLEKRPIAVIYHGPYGHSQLAAKEQAQREAPMSCCNLLFFGVIRPFKGLEDLITAFDALTENKANAYWLTIVGETWEGWTLPAELIEKSCYRDRITFVNRYVSDVEVARFFGGADAVVLPYHRSSASGPLHMAMSYGLPVVVTSVGGLTEAVAAYEGAILVAPQDIGGLKRALTEVASLRGRQYRDPHSWECTAVKYQELFDVLGLPCNLSSLDSKDLSSKVQHVQQN